MRPDPSGYYILMGTSHSYFLGIWLLGILSTQVFSGLEWSRLPNVLHIILVKSVVCSWRKTTHQGGPGLDDSEKSICV